MGKQILALLLSCMLVMPLAACANSEPKETANPPEKSSGLSLKRLEQGMQEYNPDLVFTQDGNTFEYEEDSWARVLFRGVLDTYGNVSRFEAVNQEIDCSLIDHDTMMDISRRDGMDWSFNEYRVVSCAVQFSVMEKIFCLKEISSGFVADGKTVDGNDWVVRCAVDAVQNTVTITAIYEPNGSTAAEKTKENGKYSIEEIDKQLQGTWEVESVQHGNVIRQRVTFYNGTYVSEMFVDGKKIENVSMGVYVIGADTIHTRTTDQATVVEGSVPFVFEDGILILNGATGVMVKTSD